jgi:hypothetical protein
VAALVLLLAGGYSGSVLKVRWPKAFQVMLQTRDLRWTQENFPPIRPLALANLAQAAMGLKVNWRMGMAGEGFDVDLIGV